MDELPGPISPEVEVHDDISVADSAVDAVDDRRLDEFVALAAGIAVQDGLRCGWRVQTSAVDDRVVSALSALPAPVTIHRVVAAADRRNSRVGVCFNQAPLEVPYEHVRRARRRVAPIQQAVHEHVVRTVLVGQASDLDGVTIDRMDATRPKQAYQVQSMPSCSCHRRIHERRIAVEGAVGDCGVDAGKSWSTGRPAPRLR